MSQYVLWIDSDKAFIFNLGPKGIQKTQVHLREFDHHTHNKKDHHGNPAELRFFENVARKLGEAEELLILGPGFAKQRFSTYLETHARPLSACVIGIEDSDHPTDNQILATARGFYKTYDLYHHPIQAGSGT